MYRLVIQSGRQRGRRVSVQQGPVVIGRAPDCTIEIDDDPDMLPTHVALDDVEGGTRLRVIRDAPPPRIGGNPVTVALLSPGSRFTVGRTEFEYQSWQPVAAVTRRRTGTLQGLTFGAVLILAVVQILFVAVFPALMSRTTPSPDQVRRRPRPPAPAPASTQIVAALAAAAGTLAPEGVVSAAPPPEAVATAAAPPEGVITAAPPAAPTAMVAAAAAPAVVVPAVAVTSPVPRATSAPAMAAVSPPVAPAVTSVPSLVASAPSPATSAPPPAATPPEDPAVAARNARMQEARALSKAGKLADAARLLDELVAAGPPSAEVHALRALLYEKRGLRAQAGPEWDRALKLAPEGSPLLADAAAARQRITRAEIMAAAPVAAPGPAAAEAPRLPRRLRIDSIARDRFPHDQDLAELRQVRIGILPRTAEAELDPAAVRVQVVFYDRDEMTGRVQPTRVAVRRDLLPLDTPWSGDTPGVVTATYAVPAGFRAEEERRYGDSPAYEGVRVRVLHRGVLEDEDAVPLSLLDLPAPPMPK